jgi:DNA-binding transcriptional ArsR family regulator
MDQQTQQRIESRARIIKALAHPTRLFIVEQLSHGERCVNELTTMIGHDTSTVSKHLAVLKNAGLVNIDKRGLQVYYTLKTPCILNFLSCVEDVVQANLDEQLISAGGSD